MDTHLLHRRGRAPLTVASAMLCLLATSSPVTGSESGLLFTGGGYGPTPATAIQSAIWDAQETASAYQLYSCSLVGQPQIFVRPNARFSRNFSAEAIIACTP